MSAIQALENLIESGTDPEEAVGAIEREYDITINEVSYELEYDDHGNAEVWQVWQVGTEGYLRTSNYVEANDYHAQRVTPVTKTVTVYVPHNP